MNLSDLTTLQIGGPAKEVITVKTESELIKILSDSSLITHHSSPLVIGSGSNLLVSDDGFNGTIIKNEIKGIEQKGNKLNVKSGTILQDLVAFANNHGLSGLQNLAGIPGTLGGAIYGNAGAYGQTIFDHIVNVKIFNPITHHTSLITKNECNFSYRSSIFKQTHDIILEAEFELTLGNSAQLIAESEETVQKRLIKYPIGIKCPGSFFQNIVASTLPDDILKKIPPEKIMYGKVPAGSLLEEVGAKGDQLGQIKIAPYHANLFINLGGGTAKDFYRLAKKYHQKVKGRFGISLEPEVQLINLPEME